MDADAHPNDEAATHRAPFRRDRPENLGGDGGQNPRVADIATQ
jgi:hypothetical protein